MTLLQIKSHMKNCYYYYMALYRLDRLFVTSVSSINRNNMYNIVFLILDDIKRLILDVTSSVKAF